MDDDTDRIIYDKERTEEKFQRVHVNKKLRKAVIKRATQIIKYKQRRERMEYPNTFQ